VKRLCPVAWYGGKSSHLSWLLPIIDGIPHQTYVESFGGSAAVLLNKQISPVEVYNDLYGDVAHFFRILRDHGEELITALHLTPYSREEFSSSCGEKADVSDIERARRFFVRARQVTLGLAETATPGRWSYTKGPPRRGIAATVSRWLSAIEGLEEVVARLRLVQIENENGLDTIVRYDSQDTLHYVDPPYPSETRMIGLQWRHYRWFLRFGLRVVAGPFSQYCRHCGFEFDFFEKPWFVCYQSGYYNTDHSGPVHWVCGIQTCPRCHHRDAVEDSS
jgi:DNA adenine methylase